MEKNNDNLLKSVKFLFARPSFEGYYEYCLDDLNSMQLMDKDSLRNLLIKLECLDFIKTNYYFDRNLPFFFDCKEKKFKEFELETLTKEDVSKEILDDMKVNSIQNNTNDYDYYFGKDSTFYQNNFTERFYNGYN